MKLEIIDKWIFTSVYRTPVLVFEDTYKKYESILLRDSMAALELSGGGQNEFRKWFLSSWMEEVLWPLDSQPTCCDSDGQQILQHIYWLLNMFPVNRETGEHVPAWFTRLPLNSQYSVSLTALQGFIEYHYIDIIETRS